MTRQERWKRIGDGWAYNKLLKLRDSEDKFLDSDIAWMESLPASDDSKSAYYAGTLPEVVVRPPKDNAVYKANYMIPNKKLRNLFYDALEDDVEYENINTSSRDYINKLYNLYLKSNKPTIKDVNSRISTMPILLKIGFMKGDETRASYDPVFNTMYIDPDYATHDIVAEMAHAYLIRGTDTPRNFNWMKQFFSRPNGDIKINGVDGYNTPGSLEYVAHRIIQPRFNMYLNSNKYPYDFIWKSILDAYNRPIKKPDRGRYINTSILK